MESRDQERPLSEILSERFEANCFVTIIIPVYNVEPWLYECLDSVINQTYHNLEIILVDDGSNDNSGAICDEYAAKDSRIIVVHKENEGLSAARNTGIDRATGKYVWFIDSDDWVERNAVELLVTKAEETQCEVVMFEAVIIETDDPKVSSRYKNDYGVLSGIDYINTMINRGEGLSPEACFKLFSLRFLKDNHLRFVKGLLHEDEMFFLDFLVVAKKMSQLRECLYNYRKREGSIMTTRERSHLIKMCESHRFIFYELYSMYRREKISEVVFKHIIKAHFWPYLRKADLCQYEKHHELMQFLAEVGVLLIDIRLNVILYGAGERARRRIQKGEIKPSIIFDVNADEIKELEGIPVVKPDFSVAGDERNIVVIGIKDSIMVDKIKERFDNATNVVMDYEYIQWSKIWNIGSK